MDSIRRGEPREFFDAMVPREYRQESKRKKKFEYRNIGQQGAKPWVRENKQHQKIFDTMESLILAQDER